MVTRVFRRTVIYLRAYAVFKGDPCHLCQSLVAMSEGGPSVARSSGSFGKPRNFADYFSVTKF